MVYLALSVPVRRAVVTRSEIELDIPSREHSRAQDLHSRPASSINGKHISPSSFFELLMLALEESEPSRLATRELSHGCFDFRGSILEISVPPLIAVELEPISLSHPLLDSVAISRRVA